LNLLIQGFSTESLTFKILNGGIRESGLYTDITGWFAVDLNSHQTSLATRLRLEGCSRLLTFI